VSDWTGAGTAATTLTYDDALATDRDKVRFHLADTMASSGPRPSGGNFTDDEIAGLVNAEGSWKRAVAAGLDRLAIEWGSYADITEGPHKENLSQIAARYAERATEWRKRHGASSAAGSRHVTRVDGYSNDIPADED
jgi:hypothetical protein